MLVRQVITELEMTDAGDLRPAPPAPGLALAPVADPAGSQRATLRRLHDEIAAAHHWSSLAWSEERWTAWLSRPGQHHWFVVLRGEPVGWACLQVHEGAGVEIDDFGLVPAVIGHGYGGAALSGVTRLAWSLLRTRGTGPDAGPWAHRVWLHTSSLDHAHALGNYLARGFRVFAQRQRLRTVPTGAPGRSGRRR